MKKSWVVLGFVLAALVPTAEAQYKEAVLGAPGRVFSGMQVNIPAVGSLVFGPYARPESVVALYMKQSDLALVSLDVNASPARVLGPNDVFRISFRRSRWFYYGDWYGYGYGWYGGGYSRQVRLTANICPAEAVEYRDTEKVIKKKTVRVRGYECRVQPATLPAGDFTVYDPAWWPQQVGILYFCGSWPQYWISPTGCPLAQPPAPSAAATTVPLPLGPYGLLSVQDRALSPEEALREAVNDAILESAGMRQWR